MNGFTWGSMYQTVYLCYSQRKYKEMNRMVSCLLKHLTRKIKSNVIRRFDVSNIIIKNEDSNVGFAKRVEFE